MPASITLSNLQWSTPEGKTLFSGLNLQFSNERTGLVGRNGVGKSTLLSLIIGDLKAHSGTISINGTYGILRQNVQPVIGQTIADLFDVRHMLEVLARAENGLANTDELASADWTLEDRIKTALFRAGLSADLKTPMTMLSGGQRTRAALAALIFKNPNFLLLDEPTNNLDRQGREIIADLLMSWKGGAIIISHDRALLETMDAIVELSSLGATRYGGNWSHYKERKNQELAAAHKELNDAEKQMEQTLRNAQLLAERKARKDNAGKAKRAKGDAPKILLDGMKNRSESTSGSHARLAEARRMDAQAALEAARQRIEQQQPLTISLRQTNLPTGKTVLKIDNIAAGYLQNKPIIKDFSLHVTGPERIAIRGENGSGKTTLLSIITGKLLPWKGQVMVCPEMTMLDQQVSILDPQISILENFQRINPAADNNACRMSLARFMFRADAALQKAGTLSGGQLLRAGLACTLGSGTPPKLLILDEPTNHLDIESIETVEAGLRDYDGALIVVSHDEAFLEAIGITRTINLVKS